MEDSQVVNYDNSTAVVPASNCTSDNCLWKWKGAVKHSDSLSPIVLGIIFASTAAFLMLVSIAYLTFCSAWRRLRKGRRARRASYVDEESYWKDTFETKFEGKADYGLPTMDDIAGEDVATSGGGSTPPPSEASSPVDGRTNGKERTSTPVPTRETASESWRRESSGRVTASNARTERKRQRRRDHYRNAGGSATQYRRKGGRDLR